MSLLQLKKKILQQLDEDNAQIKAKRIEYALDYASLLAITFMRRVQLIKLKSHDNFVQLEYDYKVWKSKRVLASYFLTDCIGMMKKAKGDPDKSLIRFLTTVTDCLDQPFRNESITKNWYSGDFTYDSEHIAILMEMFIELDKFCKYLEPEPKKVLSHTIIRLEALEMKYDKHSIDGYASEDDWKKEAQRQTKIKML